MRTKSAATLFACCFLLLCAPSAFAQSDGSSDKEESESEKKDDENEDEKAKTEAQRRKDMAKKVQVRSILHSVGTMKGKDGKAADALSEGAGKTSMAEAFADSKGMGKADKDGKVSFHLGLHLSEVAGEGKLPESRVANVVKRRSRAISRCIDRHYSKVDKGEAKGGKLAVKFTVGKHGRINKVEFTEDTLGGSVASCAKHSVKRWRFPRPKGGSVTASLTWEVTLDDE